MWECGHQVVANFATYLMIRRTKSCLLGQIVSCICLYTLRIIWLIPYLWPRCNMQPYSMQNMHEQSRFNTILPLIMSDNFYMVGWWPHVSTWEIENNIIHGFVDKLSVVDESKGYAPPHVPLAKDTIWCWGCNCYDKCSCATSHL